MSDHRIACWCSTALLPLDPSDLSHCLSPIVHNIYLMVMNFMLKSVLNLMRCRKCLMLMQVDITERAKVEATLAKLTESQASRASQIVQHVGCLR